MLTTAEAGQDDSPIIELSGKMFKQVRRGRNSVPQLLSTFIMRPIEAILSPGEGEYLAVELSSKTKRAKGKLPPSARTSTQAFLSWLPSKEFAWYGTSTKDLQLLRSYQANFEVDTRIGVHFAGFHDGKFVTEEGGLSVDGPTREFVYIGENPSRCRLLSQKPLSRKERRAIGAVIKKFNTPDVALSVLGWTVACFFKC